MNNVASALILEDDADWDIGIRAQLAQLAKGSRYLQGVEESERTNSVYGDNWDLMWVGHCGSWTNHEDKRRWVIENDPTVEPPPARHDFGEKPDITRG